MCEMAMDALKHITGNVPHWLDRLEELSGKIEQRQLELAAIASSSSEPKPAGARSLRNKGSTESLKPADDGPSMIPDTEAAPRSPLSPGEPLGATRQASGPANTAVAGAAGARQANGAPAKKRQRSASMFTADKVPQALRTRRMIIVYYDSYVQGFFDDLVRFVSSSRNMMRKAKMAARVAQIKKMAEMDMSQADGGEEDGESLPSLRYLSTRRMGLGRAGLGGLMGDDQPDAYSLLDKGLEFVQCTCEHGAHQFLRDADCKDEISKIGTKLREVLELAQKEMDRILVEEPELAKETSDLERAKSRRTISVRRELSAQHKDGSVPFLEPAGKQPDALISARSRSSYIEPATQPIKPDELEPDEGIDVELEMPKLQYRSTRNMRAPRAQYVSDCT